MGRGVGLVTLVITLTVSAVLFATQWSSLGGGLNSRTRDNRLIEKSKQLAAAMTAQRADMLLESYHAATGTYAGAPVEEINGIRLLHADASGFCLQVDARGETYYDAGPYGHLATTAC